ncbi:hypothetical protein C8J56DRAFT_1026977 [Mycena floridula]|nr:hypothetical protein C8J56DRAFT_1026977 [Mycena floridula]
MSIKINVLWFLRKSLFPKPSKARMDAALLLEMMTMAFWSGISLGLSCVNLPIVRNCFVEERSTSPRWARPLVAPSVAETATKVEKAGRMNFAEPMLKLIIVKSPTSPENSGLKTVIWNAKNSLSEIEIVMGQAGQALEGYHPDQYSSPRLSKQEGQNSLFLVRHYGRKPSELSEGHSSHHVGLQLRG